jgi:hypothetical protein
MIGPRYVVPMLCGLLIAGVGTAEARGGGGGHAASHDTSRNGGPYRQIPHAYHKIPHAYVQGSRAFVQGPSAHWRFPFQGSQAYRQTLNAGRAVPTCGPGGCHSHREVPTGPSNPYPSAPDPAGGQRAMTPMAASYASAPQFQFHVQLMPISPKPGAHAW